MVRQRIDSAAAAATRDHATTTDLIEGEGGENRRLSSIFPVFAEVFRSPIECPLSHSLRQRLSSPPSGPGPCSLREVPVLAALMPSSPALSPPPLVVLLLLLPLATLRGQTVCVCAQTVASSGLIGGGDGAHLSTAYSTVIIIIIIRQYHH